MKSKMKQQNKWFLTLSITLLAISAAIYSLQLLIFANPKDTFFYLFQDLAFVPISVLLVTLVIDNLMKKREKRILINKMNMVVGIFFSQMGNRLLQLLSRFDSRAEELENLFEAKQVWSDGLLQKINNCIQSHPCCIELSRGDLDELKVFLTNNRERLMRLLENPNLLEHEGFTDVLWALSHLTEEMALRNDLAPLPQNDAEHLKKDIQRAYVGILGQWIAYLKHLRDDYPYIFSLAIRNNPFNKHASIQFD